MDIFEKKAFIFNRKQTILLQNHADFSSNPRDLGETPGSGWGEKWETFSPKNLPNLGRFWGLGREKTGIFFLVKCPFSGENFWGD